MFSCGRFRGPKRLRASVFSLFGTGGPFTVLFTVWAIVVDSFYSESRQRPFSHVIEKGKKAGIPSITNCDTPSAVVAIGRVFRVITARSYVCPAGKFRSFAHAVSAVKTAISVCILNAATRSFSAASKAGNVSCGLFAAIADTSPFGRLSSNYRESFNAN